MKRLICVLIICMCLPACTITKQCLDKLQEITGTGEIPLSPTRGECQNYQQSFLEEYEEIINGACLADCDRHPSKCELKPVEEFASSERSSRALVDETVRCIPDSLGTTLYDFGNHVDHRDRARRDLSSQDALSFESLEFAAKGGEDESSCDIDYERLEEWCKNHQKWAERCGRLEPPVTIEVPELCRQYLD